MKKEKEEKKKEDEEEEEEEKEEGPSKEDINDMFNTAAEIKSYQLAQERKKFDSLPDFYKDGLFNYLTLINVRNQKFYLKKCSFETMKNLGIQYLKFQSFDEAITEFSKSISIFKYIIDSNPNWKNGDGIKDSELTYIFDEGSNKEEKEEIKNMLKSSLLNLSLCNFYLKNWKEVKFACDEVIKIDNKCIKAYFRKARCIIDNPASLMNDYLEAKNLLEKAIQIDPNNKDVNETLNNLNQYINKEKSEEKKIYKSFYRKINEQYTENEKKKEEEKKNNIIDYDKNDLSGKAQIRMLNLILEICYAQMEVVKTQKNNKKEENKLSKIIEQAKKYRDDLQDLIDIDFNNPNEKLKSFAKEENLDLQDKKVQEHFLALRKKIIDEVNEFHEKNLNKMRNKNKDNMKLLKNLKEENKRRGFKNESDEENEIFEKIEKQEENHEKIKPTKKKKEKSKKIINRIKNKKTYNNQSKKVFIITFIILSLCVLFRYLVNYIVNHSDDY